VAIQSRTNFFHASEHLDLRNNDRKGRRSKTKLAATRLGYFKVCLEGHPEWLERLEQIFAKAERKEIDWREAKVRAWNLCKLFKREQAYGTP
jgi:hypothetical protein